MEDLQDAIEDAQYMNAVHDDSPKPTKEWKYLPAEKLKLYIDRVEASRPSALQLETICARPLGLYMFVKFGRDRGYVRYCRFLLEVAKYRTCAVVKRPKVAAKIRLNYLCDMLELRTEDIDSKVLQNTPCLARSVSALDANATPVSVEVFTNPTVWRQYMQILDASALKESVKQPAGGEEMEVATEVSTLSTCSNPLGLVGAPLTEVSALVEAALGPPAALNSPITSNSSASAPVREDKKKRISPVPSAGHHRDSYARTSSGQSLDLPAIDAVVRNAEKAALASASTSAMPTSGKSSALSGVENAIAKLFPKNLFDALDMIVYHFLEERLWVEFQRSSYWQKYWQLTALAEVPVTESDFSLFRVLGRGGFGLVNGCKHCASGKLFAMKMINKKRVKMKKAENLCLNERNILAAIDSPFIVCLKYAFSTATDLYLIVDLMLGGDLGFHLARKTRFSEQETKFYAARTVMGLLALHEKDIVYRDLKPENILMDSEGYTRISDLGLATNMPEGGLQGTCGTRGYWAPEMLRRDPNTGKREKYFKQVDWFSFGCMIYEFIYGCGPFRTPNARKWGVSGKLMLSKEDRDKAIDQAILEMEPEFDPQYFRDPVTVQFISTCLEKRPFARLGSGGVQEIMQHPFFKEIDWSQIQFQKPPWKPAKNINMASQSEIGQFSDDKEYRRVVLLPEDHLLYDNWDFINLGAFEEEVVEYLQYEEAAIYTHGSGSASCCIVS